MPYGFVQHVPANREIYEKIRAQFPAEKPDGLVAHIACEAAGGGLVYTDVWTTQAAWNRFREDTVEPAVSEVLAGYGIPHDHSLVTTEDIEVIDVWTGEVASTDGLFGFVQSVPATPEIYAEICERIGDRKPVGMVAHVVRSFGDRVEYTDVWTDHAHWLRFKNVTLVPVVTDVLSRHGRDHTSQNVAFDAVTIVDAWV